VPLQLDFCSTGVARRDDAAWIRDRFRHSCAEFGATVRERDDRLVVEWG